MSLVQTVAPTVYPIDVADLKAHSRIDTSDGDSYVSMVIAAATDYVEGFLDRQLINATYVLRLSCLSDEMRLPRSPLSSVTSVQYVDTAGTTQTLSTSYYDVDAYTDPGLIRRKYEVQWPQVREHGDPVTITFVAGYGASKTAVPAALRQGVAVIAAYMYEHREHVIVGTIAEELPGHVMNWLWQWRNVGFG